jgi:RNA polymerase sigma-70 factor (ECF subfamily)
VQELEVAELIGERVLVHALLDPETQVAELLQALDDERQEVSGAPLDDLQEVLAQGLAELQAGGDERLDAGFRLEGVLDPFGKQSFDGHGEEPESRPREERLGQPGYWQAVDIARLFERNKEALTAYVRRHAGALVRWKESVSDLLQTTFREVIRNCDQLEGQSEETQRQWLFRTAECKLRNRARHWRAERRELLREQVSLERAEPMVDQRVLGRESDLSPSEKFSLQETTEQLERALAALPDEYREVIRLMRVEGLPYAEVAERMGRSEVAVRKLLSRALARLVEDLTRDGVHVSE